MSKSASFKIRAVGSASALALTVGLATTAVAQNMAPAPVDAVPMPMAPAAPGNGTECALDAMAMPSTVTCAPGTDANGFQDPALNAADLNVEAGAQVQGEIALGTDIVAAIDGDIIVAGGQSALDLGTGASVVNNGYLSATPFFDGIISVGNGSTVTNTGIITTATGNVTAGILSDGTSTYINDGLIALRGPSVAGIVGNFFGSGATGGSVTNSVNGQIIIDTQSAGFGFGLILFGDGSVVTNDGLIQTIGANNTAIQVNNGASITNNGNLVATGAGSEAIIAGNDAMIGNTGLIATDGDDGVAVTVGADSMIGNSGTIMTEGDDADAIVAGDNLDLTNSGTIVATGADARGIETGDGFMLMNSGTIEATDRAINAGDDVTITNVAGGLINTTGDADTIQTGENTIIINNGTISNEGFDTKIIDAGDGLTVTNNGTITSDWKGIEGEANFTLTNNAGALIFSAFDEAVEADGPGLVVVNNGQIISPEDDAIDGDSDVMITNTGLIQGGENDAIELNNGTIINSGRIISLSSDPEGTPAVEGGPPELDAAIDFDAGTDGNEDGIVRNLAGGVIEGDIGIVASPGNIDSPDTNDGRQEVYNNGTITGREGDAVLLGNGDDLFVQQELGVTNGVVNGQDGFDTLTFGNTGTGRFNVDLGLFEDETRFTGFEEFSLVNSSTGIIALTGASAVQLNASGGTIQLDGDLTDTLTLEENTALIIGAMGSVDVEDNDGVRVNGDGVTITNAGLIRSNDDEAIEASGRDNLTVINSGTIIADENGDKGIEADENLTVINTGLITSLIDEAIEADGAGLTLTNSGQIISPLDDAVDGDDDVMITNSGLIQGGENDAIELNNGTIINSGMIISLSSDPEGTPAVEGGPPELDAAIDFDAGTDGNEDGIVRNLAGGVIEGDIGIVASPGNIDSPDTNDGRQEVYNNGTITGREGDAVLLGNGDDLFVQEGTGALVNGNVGLQAGDDTFMLAGSLSSITGVVDGGTGVDAAFLSGILDTDRIVGFEAISLGQSAALTVSGNRSLTGNVTFDGVVRFGLGVDSLSVSGDVLLAEGAVIEIATPLDNDLVGQTVTVIAETGTFNDAGAQIVILDNDLLINYVPQFGSLSVAVNAFSPLAGSNDSNIAAFSNAIAGGVTAGTIGTANFDALNAIGDIGTFEQSLVSGLPALNDGTAREIFETSNVAAQALNRHLAGEGSRLWGQIVARGADQDARALSAVGYDSDQLVFTAGFDLGVGETLRVGVLGSYADIDTTDLYSGTASGTAQTESYKIGGYLGARFAGRGFINAEASYLTGQTEALRSGFLGTIASTTDFDGYTAQATVGYDLLPDENVRIVPAIGVNYASISFDDTRESGGFGFLIAQEDAEFVELRGGIELGAALEGGVDAFISGTVIRDLEDDASIVVLSSSQLPTFNVALPARSADRFELAAGAAVNILQNFALELGYLGDFNEGYSAHSGRVKVRFAF